MDMLADLFKMKDVLFFGILGFCFNLSEEEDEKKSLEGGCSFISFLLQ